MNGVKVTALGRLSKQLQTLRAVPARPCSLAACSRKKTRNAARKSLYFIQIGRNGIPGKGEAEVGRELVGLSVVLIYWRIRKGSSGMWLEV